MQKNKKTTIKKIMTTEIHKLPWKTNLLIAGPIIGLMLLYDLSGIGGNIPFYVKWAECGQRPFESRDSGFMNVGAVHYVKGSVFRFARFGAEFFCTPLEAEKAGLSADSSTYNFPHIEAERERRGDL